MADLDGSRAVYYATVTVIPVELASQRKIRDRNKASYRVAHWPIWIWVFFITPGPLTFDLFESGFDQRMATWLGAVLLVTGLAALRGRLPGVEPRPYIIRFTEDKPNPLYRRVCYTFAWSAVLTFALLNIAGLIVALVTGEWHLRQIYEVAYFPIAITIWIGGAAGLLPRKAIHEGGGARYFYGSMWAVCLAQVLELGARAAATSTGRCGPCVWLNRCCGFLNSETAHPTRRARAGD